MDLETPTTVDASEAALDAEINASIDSIKAGNALVPEIPATPVKPEVKAPEATPPAPATGEGEPSTPPSPATGEADPNFRIPNKDKFESDEAYEKRIELFDLVRRRRAATTPEAKEALSIQIKTTKSQLRNLGGNDKITNPPNLDVDPNAVAEDPAVVADRERLKALGGATTEDVAEIIRQERFAQETQSTLTSFVGRHEELKDADMREVFFNFVEDNYNWQGKTGKELMTVLELAKEAMFKPSETIEERVIKGADVAAKVNAMQFPGGTTTRQEFSPEMRKSIDEMKATGMSEEKAIELLSD